MARRGVRKLEVVEHNVSGIDVAIYLNTHNSTFEAEVKQDGEIFIDKDLNVLKKNLQRYLDDRTDLGWRWIIELEMTEKVQSYSGSAKEIAFGFSKKKYLVSKHRVNGKYLSTEPRGFTEQHIDYNNKEKYYLEDSRVWRYSQRSDEGDLKFPWINDDNWGGKRIFVEYNDEVWAALKQMQEQIIQVAERFSEMIGTDEGYNKMEQIGREILKMLPAPEES